MTTALSLLDDAGLLEALREREMRRRREHFRDLQLIGEAIERGLATHLGHKDLPDLLAHALRWDRKDTKRRMRQATQVCPTITPTGTVLPLTRELAAAAMAEGELSPEHLEEIIKAMPGLPAEAEAALVGAARTFEPRVVARLAGEVRARVDQDGSPPTDEELAQPRNRLWTRRKRDGRVVFRGELEPEAGAQLEALLSPLAKPRPSSVEGPDERTLAERQGDALCELLDIAHRSGDLPTEAGEKPHVSVTIDFEALRTQVGRATLTGEVLITASQVRRMACDAAIIPVVLGTNGVPLDIGRQSRELTVHLRRALHVRDGGCAFPGCARPAEWCHAHHVIHWVDGGPTALGNLVLLCGRHHRLVHHSAWEVRMDGGLPVFYPPAYVDPARRPLRNPLYRRVE